MIDILITTYNSERTIHGTLASLAAQSVSSELDVTIVDDGSDSPEYIRAAVLYWQHCKSFNSIVLYENSKNMGVGIAKQRAIDESKKNGNEWFLLIDSDDKLYTTYAIAEILASISENPGAKMIYGKTLEEKAPMPYPITERYKELLMRNDERCLIYFQAKAYLRKSIEDANLKIQDVRSNEDGSFNTAYACIYNNKGDIVRIPSIIVNICWNPESIMRSDISTRRCLGIVNPNDYWDNYIAFKETFKIASDNIRRNGFIPNHKRCEYFIDHFVYRLSMYLYATECGVDSFDEKDLLCRMLLFLLYKDTVKPTLLHSERMILKGYWSWPNSYYFWNPVKDFDIYMKVKELETVYEENMFNYLKDKHIVSYGYI